MTGKLADVVMAVRNGEQIARKYQPVVSNPSSAAQIAQRAKLKLMSQLSAVMAPVIAIPRQGSVSSRNLFTKKNIRNAAYSDNTASIQLEGIQLTTSVVSLVDVYGARDAETGNVTGYLTALQSDINRVVYAFFHKQADNTLRFISSQVVSEMGTSAAPWGTNEVSAPAGDVLILAYGVRDNNENARAIFGNMQAPTAQDIANLIVTRTLTESDVTLTETKGHTIAATTTHTVSPDNGDGNRSVKKK